MAAFFSAFGTVVDFKVVMDPTTGVSRGCGGASLSPASQPSRMRLACSFGFVAFVHSSSADALKSLRTIDFFGKTVRATPPRGCTPRRR